MYQSYKISGNDSSGMTKEYDEWEKTLNTYLSKVIDPEIKRILNRFNNYMIGENKSASTRYRHLQCVRTFLNFLKEEKNRLDIESIEDVEDFISYVRARGVKAGIARYLTGIKKYLKYLSLHNEKYIRIYKLVKIPTVKQKEPDLISHDDFLKILDSIKDLKYRTMLAIIYEGGLRISEARFIRKDDVEFLDDYALINIRRSKTVKRKVPIVMFVDLLKQWYQINKSDWLFPGRRDDKPIARNTLNVYLNKVCKRLGVKKRVYPHLFRHLRATELYKRLNEMEMRLVFGWRSNKMLNIYAHLSNQDAIQKIIAIQKGKPMEIQETLKSLKCPRCGFENNPTAKFCSQCGYVLSSELRVNIISYEAKIQELDKLMNEVKSLLYKIKQKYVI